MMDDGHLNPLENKHTLDRHLKGMNLSVARSYGLERTVASGGFQKHPTSNGRYPVGTPLGVRATALAIDNCGFLLFAANQ